MSQRPSIEVFQVVAYSKCSVTPSLPHNYDANHTDYIQDYAVTACNL